MVKSSPLTKATFTPDRTASLLEDLIIQNQKGLRPEKIFKREAWRTVTAQFNARWGTDYTVLSMKNHFNVKRSEYRAFEALRSAPGAGWNEEEALVTGSDEFWERYLQSHKAAKPFRKMGFPVFHLMRQLEGNQIADDHMVHGTGVIQNRQLGRRNQVSTRPKKDFDDSGANNGGNVNDGTPEHASSAGELDGVHEADDDECRQAKSTEEYFDPRILNSNLTGASQSTSTSLDLGNFGGATRAQELRISKPSTSSSSSQKRPRCSSNMERSTRPRKNISAHEALLEFTSFKRESMEYTEASRIEEFQLRDEARAERHAQAEEARIEREALTEERMRRLEMSARGQSSKFENQSKAMKLFGADVHDHITEPREKMKAAIVLQDESLSFFFISLPPDMRWPWLIEEANKQK